MSKTFDAVLVGGGHNALACAIHLISKGWRVAVFEGASVAGGAVKTGEYTLSGFRHDWAAMNMSLFAGSQFFKDHGDKLLKYGLEFTPAAHPFASVFPDGKWLGVSTDAQMTLQGIAAFSQRDAETWQALSKAFPERAGHIFGLIGQPMKIYAFASFLWKLWRGQGVRGGLDLTRFLLQSPREWLEATFETPHLRALLGAWGMHIDFAPDTAGGALFPYLEGMAGQAFGMVLPKGGADAVIKAMVAHIEASGSEVHVNAPATKVLTKGGKATGIRLASGEEVFATKAVIAGVAPKGLMQLIETSGEARFDQAMKGFTHAPGTLMLHLAMKALPAWAAGPQLSDYAYVHIAPSLDQMAQTYQQAKAGLLPSEPILVVGQPTVVDPSRAPAGHHTLWVQMRVVPAEIKGDAAGRIAARTWQDAAEPMAERALEILERYAPGTRAHILSHRVVTPVELEADNPNLVGGDQICGSHHLSQNFIFRPAFGHADGSTPIQNLHLTGAAVWPGAGTGAGAGYLLAKKLAGS